MKPRTTSISASKLNYYLFICRQQNGNSIFGFRCPTLCSSTNMERTGWLLLALLRYPWSSFLFIAACSNRHDHEECALPIRRLREDGRHRRLREDGRHRPRTSKLSLRRQKEARTQQQRIQAPTGPKQVEGLTKALLPRLRQKKRKGAPRAILSTIGSSAGTTEWACLTPRQIDSLICLFSA